MTREELREILGKVGVGLKAYPEYRDSGVQWLGEIPRGWEVHRLKRFLPSRHL